MAVKLFQILCHLYNYCSYQHNFEGTTHLIWRLGIKVFNATFNNISVIPWWRKPELVRECHEPVTSHWTTFITLCCLHSNQSNYCLYKSVHKPMLYKSTKLIKSPGTLDRVKGNRHYGCELNSKLKWWFLHRLM